MLTIKITRSLLYKDIFSHSTVCNYEFTLLFFFSFENEQLHSKWLHYGVSTRSFLNEDGKRLHTTGCLHGTDCHALY
jgi:hypothetical protein